MSRREKENLLDFFLNARRSLVEKWQRDVSVGELRKIAEERFSEKRIAQARYLADTFKPGTCVPVPELVFDSEFAALLGRAPATGVAAFSGEVCGIFVPPEQGIMTLNCEDSCSWSRFLADVPQGTFCLRTGFFSTEFDVLETVALGFQGMCVHARALDLYEIQLLTEICRDFHTTLVAVADSPATVARILESDCPYVGLWGYDAQSFAPSFAQLTKMSPKIPTTCHRLGFLPSAPKQQNDVLVGMGLSGCVC